MAVLKVENLTKVFGATRAIDNISFDVELGDIMVIVGGSGCGKTTTLRCIAGLEDPTDGVITVDGKVVTAPGRSVPPEQRRIGMVFQSYALWPHRTVYENVAYGLQRQKLPTDAARDKVTGILKQVGLSGFEDRYPSTLSGGQQQRVALARSAVLQPRLLLLDEPLSNLDAKLREQMRDELREMIKMFGMTAVHITHDQAEAMALADTMICMRSGRIEQVGSPRAIYRTPANFYVADFIGACSFLTGVAIESDREGTTFLIGDAMRLRVWTQAPVQAGAKRTIAIRPDGIQIGANKENVENQFTATMLRETFLGSHSEYLLAVGGHRLKADSSADLTVGQSCHVSIDPAKIVLVPD
jgi:iron(III) transport system ATP-binding protein